MWYHIWETNAIRYRYAMSMLHQILNHFILPTLPLFNICQIISHLTDCKLYSHLKCQGEIPLQGDISAEQMIFGGISFRVYNRTFGNWIFPFSPKNTNPCHLAHSYRITGTYITDKVAWKLMQSCFLHSYYGLFSMS